MNEMLTKKPRKKWTAKMIAITGITAAVYAVATMAIAPLGFGPIQFRFSEILILLAFLDIGYAPGLLLGCAIANCFSPMGIVDVVVGSAATACTLLAISKTKSLFAATLWPTVFCVFVGAELFVVSGFPFFITTATVMMGEFMVVTVIGYPLFRQIMKNSSLAEQLKINK